MSSRLTVLATVLRRTVRRNGWSVLAILVAINVLHWQRQGTLDWGDARSSLAALAGVLMVFMLVEAKRMHDEARASSPDEKS